MNGGHCSISQAAQASGVTVKAIRYYEEIGLIPHTARRTNGGQGTAHRVFAAAAIGRLRFIHQARALGLGLHEIRELVAIAEKQGCPGRRPEYHDILSRHLESINDRINRLLQLRSALAGLINADRSSAQSACCWETCGCMEADLSMKEGLPSVQSRPRRKNGGNHV